VRILDYGGDTGNNAPFENQRKLLHVYDIGHRQVVKGAVKIDKAKMRVTRYDLIVCANVLEHVSYPADVLNEIVPLMDKDTILYVEVPFEG
ncbi:class I SAM-dependent methyltransferase, partial [Erwinia amylovora]|uniref:methyltransferase domain-containing protein n=1 Tax=Erwinia amylovora TaxID=552 RepID=UPI0020BEAF54